MTAAPRRLDGTLRRTEPGDRTPSQRQPAGVPRSEPVRGGPPRTEATRTGPAGGGPTHGAQRVIPRPAPAYAEQAPTGELLVRLARSRPGEPEWSALRAELCRRHRSLVRALAWRFRGRGEDLDDLVQVGTVGLLHAIDRFDPDCGAEFTTYATPTIVGELKHHLRDRASTVRVPRRLQERHAAVSAASVRLYQRLGRSPTVHELAEATGLTDEEVLEALEVAQASTTIPLDDSDTGTDTAARDSADALAGVENRAALRPLLDRLPPREKRIIVLRFFAHRTQSEIAAELGISQVQVSRLLTRTLTTLRTALAD